MKKFNIKIEFTEEAETLGDILKCKKCSKPMKAIDTKSYKFDCECQDKSVVVTVVE